MKEPLLVVVLGPTASGKTSLSLALALQFGGEIVSCDSVAVYREFEAGTAKPTPEERRLVPHHLIDVASPAQVFTAGDYSRLARQVIIDISRRGHLPIVVGGTGLYLRALLEGLFAGPERSEELRQRLRERARERGSHYVHAILARLDPHAAQSIHANDLPKVVRAIEVCLASRRKMTDLWKQGREPLQGFRILRLGLMPDRQSLYARINARAGKMFDNGLVEETARLWQEHDGNAWALGSLGYRQVLQFIRGEISREGAMAATQQAHRNFAKRQMTWFRREPAVQWFQGFGDDPAIQHDCMQLVKNNL